MGQERLCGVAVVSISSLYYTSGAQMASSGPDVVDGEDRGKC